MARSRNAKQDTTGELHKDKTAQSRVGSPFKKRVHYEDEDEKPEFNKSASAVMPQEDKDSQRLRLKISTSKILTDHNPEDSISHDLPTEDFEQEVEFKNMTVEQ